MSPGPQLFPGCLATTIQISPQPSYQSHYLSELQAPDPVEGSYQPSHSPFYFPRNNSPRSRCLPGVCNHHTRANSFQITALAVVSLANS